MSLLLMVVRKEEIPKILEKEILGIGMITKQGRINNGTRNLMKKKRRCLIHKKKTKIYGPHSHLLMIPIKTMNPRETILNLG